MRHVASFLFLLPALVAAQAPQADFGRQVVAEINLARKDPQAYAAFLRPWLERFDGRVLYLPGELGCVTEEGRPAVAEAVAFLEKAKPLSPLAYEEGLARAALGLVREQGHSGRTGHADQAGGMPEDRILRQGSIARASGEVISYGPMLKGLTPRRVVLDLLVDDGVASRGHRELLFSAEFEQAGGALGPHPDYESVCVVDLASGFRPKGPAR